MKIICNCVCRWCWLSYLCLKAVQVFRFEPAGKEQSSSLPGLNMPKVFSGQKRMASTALEKQWDVDELQVSE